jgi:ComF family protein
VVRSLVHEIKYRHKASLARFIMGHFCSVIPSAVLDNIDYLLPVPLHGRRYRHRGYNQAAHLALGLCHTLPECPPLLDKVLKRTHYTRTQTKMDSSQRARNMQGVFALSCAAKGLIGGKHLVVVDDVVTTGATSGAVAGALLEGGAASVSVLCLARD